MEAQDMSDLVMDTLNEWLHKTYWIEPQETADYMGRRADQKIVLDDPFQPIYRNTVTQERFLLSVGVFREDEAPEMFS